MSLFKKLFLPKKEVSSFVSGDMEICVHCGTVTSVPVSMPIESRPNYISGCGQLCPECYAKLGDSLDDNDAQLVCAVLEKGEKNT